MGIAPALFAAAARSGAGSRRPKKFGRWKITAAASSGGSLGCCGPAVGVGRASVVGNLDDLEAESARVGADDLPHLRVRRLGDDDLGATGGLLGDEARIGGDGRPVVARGVRDVHAREL